MTPNRDRLLSCTMPPPGWWCSRAPGHEGPCAARPDGEAIWQAAEAAQTKRADDMPEDQDAIFALNRAYQRLTALVREAKIMTRREYGRTVGECADILPQVDRKIDEILAFLAIASGEA